MSYNRDYENQLITNDRQFCKKLCSVNGIELEEGRDSYSGAYMIYGARDKNTGESIPLSSEPYYVYDIIKNYDNYDGAMGMVVNKFDGEKFTILKNFELKGTRFPVAESINYFDDHRGQTHMEIGPYFPSGVNSSHRINLTYSDIVRTLYIGRGCMLKEENLKSLGILEITIGDLQPSKSKITVELGYSSTTIRLFSDNKEIVVENDNLESVIEIVADWLSNYEYYKCMKDNYAFILELVNYKLATSMEIMNNNPELYVDAYNELKKEQEQVISEATKKIQMYEQEISQMQQQSSLHA